MLDFWQNLSVVAVLHVVLLSLLIPWILLTKREPTAAIAWILAIVMMPIFGSLLYWIFGYNYVYRRQQRKRRHRERFVKKHRSSTGRGSVVAAELAPKTYADLGRLATVTGAFPVESGNAVALYHDTTEAMQALLAAIDRAQHHIHLEFFIIHSDAAGEALIEHLARKAQTGVEVRLLYDAMGCLRLKRSTLAPLLEAGGETKAFLPLRLQRSRLHVNLRNHRKLVVIDGRTAFTGGMNIGDEYLGRNAYFGYWRDTFMRVDGPAAGALQHVFQEDWDFAGGSPFEGEPYLTNMPDAGQTQVQVAAAGPDQDTNCIRETYLLAMLAARERLWIATPYFVPDSGLLDALRVARYRGVDVKLLGIAKPDHYIAYYASSYYWAEMTQLGVEVYLYHKGMMHSKLMMVDGRWAMVGSANIDERSLRLNFELGCVLHSPEAVAELESAFLRDLEQATRVDPVAVAQRSVPRRMLENACRLAGPNL